MTRAKPHSTTRITPICAIFIAPLLAIALFSCSLLTTRPVQEMSDTASAIRAAREVQADTLAPELYRQSNEWFFKAKHEYKFKNFDLAKSFSEKARLFAEDAEFEAIRNGGNRTGDTSNSSDPLAPGIPGPAEKPAPSKNGAVPYAYPTPTGTPMEAIGGAPPPAAHRPPDLLPERLERT